MGRMSFRPSNLWLDAALAGAVGVVFIAAAISKAAQPAPMRMSLVWLGDDLGVSIAGWLAFGLIAALVALEIALGALLLSGWRRRLVAGAALGVLVAFSAVLVRMTLDPAAPSCGCLGALELAESAQQANLLGLARNAGLLLACGAIMTPLHAQPATERVHPSPEREGAVG